jgi:hypothetical protein
MPKLIFPYWKKDLVVEGSVLERVMVPPKVAMTSTLIMNKLHTKPLVEPIQQGTLGAFESDPSLEFFLKEYIPPKKTTTKLVRLQKE